MNDVEIITIYLIFQGLGFSINKGHSFLKQNFPGFINYVERSSFNRTKKLSLQSYSRYCDVWLLCEQKGEIFWL